MGSPTKSLIEAESAVRLVIESLIDSQETLQKIAHQMENELLKRYFLAESLKRAEFRGELENILHQDGVHDVHEKGTAAGSFVRTWTELKSKLGAGDHGLLVAGEESEESTLQAYTDAIEKPLPLPLRQMLTGQAAQVESARDYLRSARDGSK